MNHGVRGDRSLVNKVKRLYKPMVSHDTSDVGTSMIDLLQGRGVTKRYFLTVSSAACPSVISVLIGGFHAIAH